MKKIFILIVVLIVTTDIIAQDSANILSVKSLTDLRSTTHRAFAARKNIVKDKPLVNMLGYYDPNDGGGGTFFYDDTSTAVDNAGTIIKPASVSGPGRWKRIFDREVNVLWFGAKRDNSADASLAINAAIKAAKPSNIMAVYDQAGGYGIVYIPGGVYKMNSTIRIRKQITITGEGELGDETKLVFAGNTRGIDINYDKGAGAGKVVLKNLRLKNYGASTDTTAHGIWTNIKFVFENLSIDNFGGNAIEVNTLDELGDGNANNSLMINVIGYYCGLNGLYLIGGESNNIGIYSCDFSTNGRCGILDYSFLGNSYVNCHVSFNGMRAATGYNNSWARKGTKFYQCIYYPYQKNVEPGVTPGWQSYWSLSNGVFALSDTNNVAAWSAGKTYFITAAYAIVGTVCMSTLTACYSEGGEGASILNSQSIAISGDHGAGFASSSFLHMDQSQYEYIMNGKGLYIPDQDSANTISGFSNLYGLTLSSRKPGHYGMQAKYFESDRTTKFFAANSSDYMSMEILGYGHNGSKYGLSASPNSGLLFPGGGYFMTDMNNGFLARRICASQTGSPTAGEWAAGSFCQNIGPDTTIVGWKCTARGKPGTWVAIKSANNNSGIAPVTGTYIGNGGSIKVNIPHGLARDPSWIGITIRSADAAGIWYATHDAVNLYINYKTSTPSGNRNIIIDWAAKL
jgi:hypothetical protein